MEMGSMVTVNQPVEAEALAIVAEEYEFEVEQVSLEADETLLEEVQDNPENLSPRPPVVTIMGHVDHGKTSLLDVIREANVVEAEAGGITQHIGAYMVRLGDRMISFLDTPGHEAFTSMRARGAKVTDIVVLVVAADDGVMPQTVEAIHHATAAGVPMVVAINKIDKPNAKPERVKQELGEHNLIPEEWGGKTIFVEVSAKKKLGIEALLEMILLQADIMELKADPDRPAQGTIVEARLDKNKGPLATVLVQTGTVKVGDPFISGVYAGKVRAMLSDRGKKLLSAGPSRPVEITGLSGVPMAGDTFIVVQDERKARQVGMIRSARMREAALSKGHRVTLEDLFQQIQKGVVKELPIIIKGDVQGSVEALSDTLERLSTDAVELKVIHGSVGGVTETDVNLAAASNAIVIGFNVRPEPKAALLAEVEKVDVRLYNVIYDAAEDVRKAMEGLLEPLLKERVLGRAEIREIFSVPKIGNVAGCYVLDGTVERSAHVRLIRDNVVVYEGKIDSLRRFKDDVKEVATGFECGIGIENYNDIKVKDIIEVYTFDKVAAKL
jgi:translation initiation factor IF-2